MSRVVERQTSRAPNGSSEEYYAPEAHVVLQYPDEKRFSLYDLLLVLVQNRRLILRCVAIFTAFALIWAVLPEKAEYVASATVVQESTDGGASSSRLGALGNMIGIQIGSSTSGLSTRAYPDIMLSQSVRLAVVRDEYYISTWDSTLTLVEYINQPSSWGDRLLATVKKYTIALPRTVKRYLAGPRPDTDAARRVGPPSAARIDAPADSAVAGIEPGTEKIMPSYPTRAEEAAVARVGDMISVNVEERTGMMDISAKTADPRLSADLIESFLRHFERHVQAFYTEKARQDLNFINERFVAAERDLQDAEQRLADFLHRNVGLGSAQLQTESARLEREVQFKSQMYSSLQAQRMQAEVGLQRSKPVITVMERPVPPRAPVESSPGAIIFFGLIFGGVVGLGLAFGRWFLDTQSEDEEERMKLDRIMEAVRPDRWLSRLRAWKRTGP